MKSKSLKIMIAAASTFVFLNTSVFAATEQTLVTENTAAATEVEVTETKEATEEAVEATETEETAETTDAAEDTITETTSETTGDDLTATVDTDTTGTTDASENTSIENAKFLDLNTIEYGNITAEGQQRCFLTQAPAGKVTVYLQNSAPNMNLNVYLFKYDTRTGSTEQVASTVYSFGAASKQLSYVSDEEAYYFIGVNTEEGYVEDNSYALALVFSDKYDSAEADDTLDTRQIFSEVPDSIIKTIDNPFDTDWTQVTLAENKAMRIDFSNTGANGSYVMKIYDSNLNLVKKLNQGETFDTTFAAGNYYIEVYSSDLAYDSESPEYKINFVKYDNLATRKKITSLPKDYKDSINNQYDQKWLEYTPDKDITAVATLTNPDSTTNYVLGIFSADENGSLVQQYGAQQNRHYSVSLKAGQTYYIEVLSSDKTYNANSKFTVNFTEYDASQTLLTMSNDGAYVVTTDASNKNLYINNKAVQLNWERDRYINYGYGAYEHLNQQIRTTDTSKITGAGYGTYTASHYGTIQHAVGVNVTDLNYFYFFYAYYNGQMPSDSATDHMVIPVDQTLIIDADTGEVVDWHSNLNYHYINNQESHVFTQEK